MFSNSNSNTSFHRPSKTSPCSPQTTTTVLRLIWIALIMLGELGTVYWTIARCRWPSVQNSVQTQTKPTHVLLISDTQVLARPTKSGAVFSFRRVFFDLTLRKHWRVASNLNPDAVVFLGDMLANGKGAHSREEYDFEARKFKSIFRVNSDATFLYVPGNEDVGLGSGASVSKNLRSYFTANFGPVNSKFVIANHTFVVLDSPGLVDEDYHRHASHITFDDWTPIPHGPVEFVRSVSTDRLTNVILLSHIPLSRSETASCGPNRERGSIRRTAGPGYQSMLGKHTTSFLLKALNPSIVFSGDNHDYCDYIHVVPGTQREASHSTTPVREVTVKSFSNSPHIKRPGFQLLTLIEPTQKLHSDTRTLSDSLCLLPDQHAIYSSVYFPALFLTFAVMLVGHIRNRRSTKLNNINASTSFSALSRGTTTLHVEADPVQLSATWSPYSPMLSTSPHASFPSDIRTPRSPFGSTTRLVASVPGSPAPSSPASFHVPLHNTQEFNEEEDLMYPSQYITHRDSFALRQRSDDEWSHVRDDEDVSVDYRQEGSQDISLSPSNSPEFNLSPPPQRRFTPSKTTWSWSYAFVLKGRRRRISFSLPSWHALSNLLELIGISNTTLTRKKRHGVLALALSMFGVVWPAAIIWTIINGFLF